LVCAGPLKGGRISRFPDEAQGKNGSNKAYEFIEKVLAIPGMKDVLFVLLVAAWWLGDFCVCWYV